MAVAITTKRWTIEELHSLPDDGNKYELVDGQLFVTPAPRQYHQLIVHKLAAALMPYVVANGLGLVWQARSVVRWGENEVEPDLFVRSEPMDSHADWKDAPKPFLVVEALSDSTRRRDLREKRRFYVEALQAPEYWIVDPEERSVRIVRRDVADVVETRTLTWHPAGAREPLVIDLALIFATGVSPKQ